MRTFIVHYVAEHGSCGTRVYKKKIKAFDAVCAKAHFRDHRRKQDEKQGRWGPWKRWYEILSVEEAKS